MVEEHLSNLLRGIWVFEWQEMRKVGELINYHHYDVIALRLGKAFDKVPADSMLRMRRYLMWLEQTWFEAVLGLRSLAYVTTLH